MRVLNVQLKFIHGGNPQVCLDYSRVLKAAGNEVFVLTNPKDPFLKKQIEIADKVISARRLGELGPYDILSILYFKGVISKINPDIIIVHDGRSAALIKRAVGKEIPVIDVNHSRGAKQSLSMDATIVTNTQRLVYYKDHLHQHPTYFIQNSLSLEDGSTPKLPRAWNEPPVIGVMSRLVHHKAVDVFIDAIHELDKRDVKFFAKVVGDGEERASLEQKIIEYNLQDKIILPGYEENLETFYKTIDIFCFPSRQEEFGLVLLWAYRYGVPVVTTDTEGPSDIAEHGKDALVVPKENAIALTDALQELLQNKTKADSLAAAGYEKLVSKYEVQKVSEQLQRVLEEVLGNRTGGLRGKG
jgi:glycosyltransferase involved in cell wall biosynthesis